jgi:hypothetical protein
VQESELDPLTAIDDRITVQDRFLIGEDIGANPSDSLEILPVGELVSFAELFRPYPELAGLELRAVDPARIIKHRLEPGWATSEQIRSTTCAGERASPNTAIVRARPSGETTFPCGLCARLSSAIATRASSLEQSIVRIETTTVSIHPLGTTPAHENRVIYHYPVPIGRRNAGTIPRVDQVHLESRISRSS